MPSVRFAWIATWLPLLLLIDVPAARAQDRVLRLNVHDEIANNVTFSGDGKTLTAFMKGRRYNEFSSLNDFQTVVIFNVSDGRVVKEYFLDPVKDPMKDLRPVWPAPGEASMISPDGRDFAAVGPDGSIIVYDTATWLDRLTLKSPQGALLWAAYSADSKLLITAGFELIKEQKDTNGMIIIFDAKKGKEVAAVRRLDSGVKAACLSPDGKTLASGHMDGTIMLWDLEAVKSKEGDKKPKVLKGHEQAVESLAFSPSGKALVSGGHDKQVRLWSLENDKEMATLVGHARTVTLVGFLDDGVTPISASPDGTIRIWDVASEKEQKILKAPEGIKSVALSPDRKHVAVGSAKGVAVWNLPSVEIKPKEIDKK